MPFVQKDIRQNVRHCFQCVLLPEYCQFAGGGFDFCTIMWQNKRRVVTPLPDIQPKNTKQILTYSFPTFLHIWLEISFVLSALIQENKKCIVTEIFRCFDLFFTGQICTFVPVQQIFRDGYSEQSVLDFIFLWFCPVFVPFGICLTEQKNVKYWFTEY